MISLITAALPIVLQIVSWLLTRAGASAEAKRQFFEFVKKAGNDFGSVKLMEYGDSQLAWLKSQPDWKETT